jgi:hypothetical protein
VTERVYVDTLGGFIFSPTIGREEPALTWVNGLPIFRSNKRLARGADVVSLERMSLGIAYTHISLKHKELVQLRVTFESTRSEWRRERKSSET